MLVRRDDGYELDTDQTRLNVDQVHSWLSTDAYWALGRSLETVQRATEGSLSFGVYAPPIDGGAGDSAAGGELVGFARVVTDLATFAWLCDVYIAPDSRGKGLSTWLVGIIRDRLQAAGVYRILLATSTAHGVYEKLGFTPLANPESWMELDSRREPPHTQGA
jgi:GNAT superfamily N-acetyltransferase